MSYKLIFAWAILNVLGSIDVSFYELIGELSNLGADILGICLSLYLIYSLYCHLSNKDKARSKRG